ncbi:MAG: RNA polymerase sigma factor [Pseudomonadota bacterium]
MRRARFDFRHSEGPAAAEPDSDAPAAASSPSHDQTLATTAPPGSDVVELYRQNLSPLAAYLRKRFGDGPPDPDDIVQLAFEKLLSRTGLDDIQNVKAYLWRTANNLLLKEKRAQGIKDRNDFEIERLFFACEGVEFAPERVLQARQQLDAVEAQLRQMPERRREAFLLHRLEGLSVAETARRIGVSRTAAVKHIARAAAELDRCLLRLQGETGNEH